MSNRAMAFGKILYLNEDAHLPAVTARDFKLALNRAGMEEYFSEPRDITLVQRFFEKREYTVGEKTVRFVIAGVKRENDAGTRTQFVTAKLSRVLDGVEAFLGGVRVDIRAGRISFHVVNATPGEEDNVDYPAVLQTAKDDFYANRTVARSEVWAVVRGALRTIGYSYGSMWFVYDRPDVLNKVHQFLALVFGTPVPPWFVIATDWLTPDSGVWDQIDRRAEEYLVDEAARAATRGYRFRLDRYNHLAPYVDDLLASGRLPGKGGEHD